MKRKIYDVYKKGDFWVVQVRGGEQASGTFITKESAVQRAAELGRNHGYAQVVIRKMDGTIESERTYGDDPVKSVG